MRNPIKRIREWLAEWSPDRDRPGFVVVVLGACAPTVAHDTIDKAEEEARRLIAGLPDTVDQTAPVMRIETAITRGKTKPEPIEVVRLAATSPPPSVGSKGPEIIKPAAQALPEGFIPWDGGECPTARWTFGTVVLRDGEMISCLLGGLDWQHRCGAPLYVSREIIAYKVNKPADFRVEAGKFYITGIGERVGPMIEYPSEPGWFHCDQRDSRLWNAGGLRAIRDGDSGDIVALAADQSSPIPALDISFGRSPKADDFFQRPFDHPASPGENFQAHSFTPHEKAALEEQAGRPIDWSKIAPLPDTDLRRDIRTVAGGGALKLELGKRYRDRDGEVVGPLVLSTEMHGKGLPELTDRWPFLGNNVHQSTYTPEGSIGSDAAPGRLGTPCRSDLIELIEED